ncbi:MAG: Flp family type IVb pilin [Bauldia sp.]|nr:MAG: Flp family type IVb pilin [Bauldia sp.]MBZ0228691.1 hypothetical protein [Bauldia sp.]
MPIESAGGSRFVSLTGAFLRATGGATAVEYAILIGMIALIVLGVAAVAGAVTGMFDTLPGYFD